MFQKLSGAEFVLAKDAIGNAFEMSPPNSLKDRIANNIVSTTIITVVTFDKR